MNCLKKCALLLLSVLCILKVQGADLRSDTLDILHYKIHLDITDLSGQTINGYTEITCTPKINNINSINLDLLKLNVDSIVLGGVALMYSYNDTLLKVSLGQTFSTTDTFKLNVFYQGHPQKDLSNWGGFYFQSGFAFNLGVGFDADPHNYGRIWFPCFDNFVERSTYSFEIITSNNKVAYCNGSLINEVVLSGDTIMRSWEMTESIPTYLACVAVGPYVDVKWNYQGLQSLIPVQIAVKSSDSTNLKGSFAHLDDAMTAFEGAYGPYLFNKVGYSIVPFGSGAMEHASNIAYPSNAINGNTSRELLMAHELAHHWWGNLVTCETQEDMWINEGWASYSEQLFLEHVYGRERYLEEVQSNHLDVIQYAHYKEEKYRAVSGLPHEYTYGTHVYDKGASMAHNLRGYMGDAKFFSSITKFLNDNKFKDVNSLQMRDELSLSSGIDLTDFFDDWVFGAGFTHISVDSFRVSPSPGLYNVDVFLRQKQRGSDHFFNNVPVSISFRDAQFNEASAEVLMSGEFASFQLQIPINPVMVSLYSDQKLVTAVTADEAVISSTGKFTFDNAKMEIDVQSVSDSFLIRAEHHWASPDGIENPVVKHRISDYRYWSVDGVFPNGLHATARLQFDGRDITSGGAGNLDNDLLINGSDSLILLYRRDASRDWWEYQHYSKLNFGGLNFGNMELDSLMPGEYALANGYSAIGIKKHSKRSDFSISPNPVRTGLKIKDESKDSSMKDVYIFDMKGRMIAKDQMNSEVTIDVSHYRVGAYLIYVMKDNQQIFSTKFIIPE